MVACRGCGGRYAHTPECIAKGDAAEAGAMAADYSPLLTMQEACEYLRVSRTTLYRYIQAGDIKSVKYRQNNGGSGGSLRFFKRSELDRFIEEHIV